MKLPLKKTIMLLVLKFFFSNERDCNETSMCDENEYQENALEEENQPEVMEACGKTSNRLKRE